MRFQSNWLSSLLILKDLFLLIVQEMTPLNSSELNSFLGNEQSVILSTQIPSHTQMPQYLQHADGGGHYQLSLVDLPLQVFIIFAFRINLEMYFESSRRFKIELFCKNSEWILAEIFNAR